MPLRSIKLALFLLLVLFLGTQALWAQGATNAGTVVGTVTDPSGAVVSGATVTLTDVATGTPRTTSTNNAGHYIFVDVTPATYSLSIGKQGFATTKAANLQVSVGQTTTFDTALQVGAAAVEVEVTAAATELQTMNATVGSTVPSVAIDNLPSLGRDVNTFIELQPGVNTDGSVAGAVNDQNFFSLDGGNNSNDMDGSGGVYLANQNMLIIGDPTGGVSLGGVGQGVFGQTAGAPAGVVPTPADSVEEFKVNTAGQTADFNSSAGAEIKVVTKRGTNAWHGTAYEYYKDNNWSSNTWQNNWLNYIPGGHIDLPAYHYSRFGGAIGGPIVSKEVLGGKTYFFGNYEGFRYPNSETIYRNVPSPALRLGLLTDSTTGAIDYNLNNTPVTFKGTTYPANYGCKGLCDPLGLGLNPLVSQIWSKYEPQSNAACNSSNGYCDGANVLGFAGNLRLPISSNFAVARVDHDFWSKNHFMTSYRYYNMKYTSDDQVDIGGFFPGDTQGTAASLSGDPIQDWYFVAGLTTNITNNTTNDFHYSYLRNWWAWNRAGAPPQLPGLGGALELMSGQSATQDLGPYNVNNQQIRRRFWDGHDNGIRDDVSILKSTHLLQFGGSYQHNFDYHQRNDSGGTINAFPVYSLGNGSSSAIPGATPLATCTGTNAAGIATSVSNCTSVASADLGVVSIASQMFTRKGSDLALQPPLTNAFDKSTIPYYNVYFSDTWHLKPTFTLTYGLGYTLEMPPTEAEGKQTVIVDAANQPVSTAAYLANRQKAALAGQVYNPELGFALVGNAANGLKYPYNPYYGGFSPRVAVAWSPHFDADSVSGKIFGHEDTVIRGGYTRIYGRTNGVVQVLVPLLGLGLEQPVACNTNLSVGGAWSCAAATYSNAFRVGSTSTATGGPTVPLSSIATPTLPQPVYPGYNNPFSTSPEALDPGFRADASDSFTVTLQRQLHSRGILEVGYIGKRITHEYQPIMLNAVPYMMTLGGQSFAQAYKNVVLEYCGGVAGMGGGGCGGSNLHTPGPGPNPGAVTPQPFFEAALKGTGYCNGYASCTAALVANEGATGTANLTNAQVWGIWSDLDKGVGCPATGCTVVNGNVGAFNFPRSMMSTPIPTSPFGSSGQYTSGTFLNTSLGYGNYNAGFVSFKMNEWHGVTMQSNLTWSKALGTAAQTQSSSELTALDPFDLGTMYGRQPFDRRLVYNAYVVYSPPFYKGESGLMGRVLGGWTFASIFTAGTGVPIQATTTFANYQAYGACDGIACADYDSENSLPILPQNLHMSEHYCHTASGTPPIPACPGQTPGNGYSVNAFSNGALDVANWRNPILGLDTKDGGYGILTGSNYWNMDFSIKKNVRVAESVGLEFQGVFANIFNHNQWFDAYPLLFNPGGWGAQAGQANPTGPRAIELGARVRF